MRTLSTQSKFGIIPTTFLICFPQKNADPVFAKLYESTEEGQKVTRNSGMKWPAVFRRIPDTYNSTQEEMSGSWPQGC